MRFTQEAGEARTLFLQNLRSRLANALYLRRVEIRVMGPGFAGPPAANSAQPSLVSPQKVGADDLGKVFSTFDASTAKSFRIKKRGEADLAEIGELPSPWLYNMFRSNSVGETFVQEEPVAGSNAWGLVNLEGEANIQIYLRQALDPTGESPDVIVIHLGTNDAAGEQNKVPMDAFKAAYKKFLANVRHRYPTALIAALEIFQPSQEKNTAVRAAVEETVASTADKRMQLIKTAGWILK